MQKNRGLKSQILSKMTLLVRSRCFITDAKLPVSWTKEERQFQSSNLKSDDGMIQLLRSFLESTRTGEFIFKSWNNLCLQLLMIEAVGL